MGRSDFWLAIPLNWCIGNLEVSDKVRFAKLWVTVSTQLRHTPFYTKAAAHGLMKKPHNLSWRNYCGNVRSCNLNWVWLTLELKSPISGGSANVSCQFNKLTSVLHASVSVIDHEFGHNIVKAAVDPRGDSRVDLQTTLTMLWRRSWSIAGQAHEKLTSICFFMITNCQIGSNWSNCQWIISTDLTENLK